MPPLKMRTRTVDPALKKARITQATELKLRGLSHVEIAQMMGVSPDTTERWVKEAKRMGLIEEVRERLSRDLLPKAADVYEQILTTPAEKLTEAKVLKGQELRLKAAYQIAQGLNALRKDAEVKATTKQTVDLDGYYQLREARRQLRRGRDEDAALEQGRASATPVAELPREQRGGHLLGDGRWRGGEGLDGDGRDRRAARGAGGDGEEYRAAGAGDDPQLDESGNGEDEGEG